MRDSLLIQKPLITEKAVSEETLRKYSFIVKPSATKNEIKKAIHDVYKVDVTSVNIIRHQGKVKKFRGIPSARSGYKKAIVTLKEGQKIDLAR